MYFYRTPNGRSETRTFLRKLPRKHYDKCVSYLKRIRREGTRLPTNIVKQLEQGLWEARPEYGGIEYRFFFFLFAEDRIGVLTAITKKKQKQDRSVIERALRLMERMRQQWGKKPVSKLQSKIEERKRVRRQIEQEADAEIAFGIRLEQSGVDCDAFMEQWRINRNQFNRISHYLYGLTDDIFGLPPALSALLAIRRRPRAA